MLGCDTEYVCIWEAICSAVHWLIISLDVEQLCSLLIEANRSSGLYICCVLFKLHMRSSTYCFGFLYIKPSCMVTYVFCIKIIMVHRILCSSGTDAVHVIMPFLNLSSICDVGLCRIWSLSALCFSVFQRCF